MSAYLHDETPVFPFDNINALFLEGYFESLELSCYENEWVCYRRYHQDGDFSFPDFRLDPYPEKLLSEAVLVVNPSGIGVKKVSKASRSKVAGGTRGLVMGRSKASNRRLMSSLSRIDISGVEGQSKRSQEASGIFLTLTYPLVFPDCEQSKKHLRALRERLNRRFSLDWALWVQEFQRRGAIHFHLVVFFKSAVNMSYFRKWISRAWFEIVDSGDMKHLKAGTQATPLHIKKGSSALMGYLAKEVSLGSKKSYQNMSFDSETGELFQTGRTWGFWYKSRVPFVVVAALKITTREGWEEFKRRVSLHYAKSPYLRGVSLYSEWFGGLLYGDCSELMNVLLDGLPGLQFVEGLEN